MLASAWVLRYPLSIQDFKILFLTLKRNATYLLCDIVNYGTILCFVFAPFYVWHGSVCLVAFLNFININQKTLNVIKYIVTDIFSGVHKFEIFTLFALFFELKRSSLEQLHCSKHNQQLFPFFKDFNLAHYSNDL